MSWRGSALINRVWALMWLFHDAAVFNFFYFVITKSKRAAYFQAVKKLITISTRRLFAYVTVSECDNCIIIVLQIIFQIPS